jgi:hypothetical protein
MSEIVIGLLIIAVGGVWIATVAVAGRALLYSLGTLFTYTDDHNGIGPSRRRVVSSLAIILLLVLTLAYFIGHIALRSPVAS